MRKDSGDARTASAPKYGIFLVQESQQPVQHFYLQKVRLERVQGSGPAASYQAAPQGLCWKRRLRFEEQRPGLQMAGAWVVTSSDQKYCLLVSGGKLFGSLR